MIVKAAPGNHRDAHRPEVILADLSMKRSRACLLRMTDHREPRGSTLPSERRRRRVRHVSNARQRFDSIEDLLVELSPSITVRVLGTREKCPHKKHVVRPESQVHAAK